MNLYGDTLHVNADRRQGSRGVSDGEEVSGASGQVTPHLFCCCCRFKLLVYWCVEFVFICKGVQTGT